MSIDEQKPKIDQLPILINAVLFEIKTAIEDVAALSVPGAGKTPVEKPNLGRPHGLAYQVIPKLNEQFISAVDGLEFEILQAKAAIEDDLLVIRKKRAEREAALHAERNQSLKVENPVNDTSLPVPDAPIKRSESQAPNEVVNLDSDDVDMLRDFEVIPKSEDTANNEAGKIESADGPELTADGAFDEKPFPAPNGQDEEMNESFDFDFSDLGGPADPGNGEAGQDAQPDFANALPDINATGNGQSAQNTAQTNGMGGDIDLMGDFAFMDLPELPTLDDNGDPIQPIQGTTNAHTAGENPEMINSIDLTALDGAPETETANQEQQQENTANGSDFFSEALDLQDFGDTGINLDDIDGWFQ